MFKKRVLGFMMAAVVTATSVFAAPIAADAASYSSQEGYVDASGVAGGIEIEADEAEELIEEIADESAIVSWNYGLRSSDDAKYVAVAAKNVESGKKVTYTKAYQLSRFVQLGYWLHLGYFTKKKAGSISITEATVNSNGKKTPVYVVAMSGTDFAQVLTNQSTGAVTDLLSGFNFSNPYVRNIKKTVLQNVPKGSNIIFTGHSLGGMVAQQCAAEPELKAKYNILNTVTFGSPLLGTSGRLGLIDLREGKTQRLGDTKDPVPYLSVNTLNIRFLQQVFGLNRENGGYSALKPITAHCSSYQRSDVWGAYDALGYKNGNNSITFDFSTTTFYETPFLLH